ncbi:MAG: hypothetical protein WCC87_19585 [Candidatus Korobacteraceae bacterium]
MISTAFAYVPPKKQADCKRLALRFLAAFLLTSGVCHANTGIAQLLTPQNGSQVSGYPAVQFSWTSVPDALQYVLWVGTTQGSYNILYVATQSTSTSSLIPPAQSYYARIWTQTSSGWFYQDSTFSTTATAYLTSPANGAIGVDPRVQTFTWTSIPNVIWYQLYIGTTPGGNDVYNSWGVTVTSLTLHLSLNSNFTYYARLFTDVGGKWTYTDSHFTTGVGIAHLITPANGSQVAGYPAVQFTWNSVVGATDYVLWVGTAPGTYNVLYDSTTSTNTSAPIAPGRTYYVRMWTEVGSTWFYQDTTFSTTPVAYMLSPENGATGIDPTLPITFSWTSVPQVIWYQIYIGTSPGSNNVYNSWGVTTTTLTVNLSWQSNFTYYVRLFTDVGGQWRYSDSTFNTGTGIAHLQSPINGATNVSQFQLFTWNAVPSALAYSLIISPTNYGVRDMFADTWAPIVSSRYVWGLLPSTYYYADMCTQFTSGWRCSQSTFTTGPAGALPNRQQFYNTVQSLTSQVRLMTQGMTNHAIPGTPLYEEMIDHGQNPNEVTCGYYSITLLDQMTPNQILGRYRELTLDGVDGHVIAEYWDPFNNKWQIADSTFGLIYFNPQTEMGQGAEDVNALLLSGDLSDIDFFWVTNNGSAYMTNYYMDPITLYNNVYPFGDINDSSLVLNYVPNSPLPYLNPSSLSVQGTYGIYVFQFANQTDQLTINNAGTIVTVTPGNTEGWAAGIELWQGWYVTSQVPPGMNMYTFKRILF